MWVNCKTNQNIKSSALKDGRKKILCDGTGESLDNLLSAASLPPYWCLAPWGAFVSRPLPTVWGPRTSSTRGVTADLEKWLVAIITKSHQTVLWPWSPICFSSYLWLDTPKVLARGLSPPCSVLFVELALTLLLALWGRGPEREADGYDSSEAHLWRA